MAKSYEIILKLRDKFSPGIMQAASTYQRVVSGISRSWSKVSDWMEKTGRKWGVLRSSFSSPFRLKMDSSDIDKASRKADTFIDKMGRLRNMNGRFAGGGGGPSGRGGTLMPWLLGGAIAGGVGAMVMGGVDMASRYAGQAFQGTVGSAVNMSSVRYNLGAQMGRNETAALERQIDAYAPGRKNDLLASAQRLAGSGIEQSKMMDTLKMLNNLSALSNTQTPELAMILSKIRSTGYLQGDEMDMFRERGINLNPYISQVMGIAPTSLRKAQEQGKITYDVFEKALNAYVGPQGGKFGNFFGQKLQTDVGLKQENMQGLWQNKTEAWGQKMMPTFGKLIDFVTEIIQKMEPVERAFGRLWKAAKDAFSPIGKLIKEVGERFGVFAKDASPAERVIQIISKALEWATAVFRTAGSVIDFVTTNPIAKMIAKITLATGGVWTFVNAIMGVAAFMAANPFTAGIIAISAIAVALHHAYESSETFRHSIIASWERFKVFAEAVPEVFKMMGRGDFTGLVGFNYAMDKLAEKRVTEAIAKDQQLRANMPKPPSAFGNFGATETTTGGKGGGTIADTGGLSSTVGNSKSQSVTISMQSLINHSEINVLGSDEGVENLESKILEALNRLLYSAGHLATR